MTRRSESHQADGALQRRDVLKSAGAAAVLAAGAPVLSAAAGGAPSSIAFYDEGCAQSAAFAQERAREGARAAAFASDISTPWFACALGEVAPAARPSSLTGYTTHAHFFVVSELARELGYRVRRHVTHEHRRSDSGVRSWVEWELSA